MSINQRLDEVYNSARVIPFNNASKLILFSDCHRGVNDWADEFAHNQYLFFYALQHYLEEGFTYIELGDGDELWETSDFTEIRTAHSHVFWIMREFFRENRLYLLWGNHDIERQSPDKVRETLYRYYDERIDSEEPLFEGIQVHEGLVLQHEDLSIRIFLTHGHQADPINDRWWWLSRFFVRRLWRHLQLLGIRDPTRPAVNYKKRGKVENKIRTWIRANQQMTICGHTHRPMFTPRADLPYFNTGSCVHPRCITGIEIRGLEISLIKWSIRAMQGGGLFVVKDLLAKPREMSTFLL